MIKGADVLAVDVPIAQRPQHRTHGAVVIGNCVFALQEPSLPKELVTAIQGSHVPGQWMVVQPPRTLAYGAIAQELDRIGGHLPVATDIDDPRHSPSGWGTGRIIHAIGAGDSSAPIVYMEPASLRLTSLMTGDLLPKSLDLISYTWRAFIELDRTFSENVWRLTAGSLIDSLNRAVLTVDLPSPQAKSGEELYLPFGSASASTTDIQELETDSRALSAVRDLRQWLHVTVDEVARLIGVSDATIFYWERTKSSPRPKNSQILFRIHALVRALRSTTGAEPISVLRSKASSKQVSPYELLEQGRYDEAEAQVRDALFGTRNRSARWSPSVIEWNEEDVPSPPAGKGLAIKKPRSRSRRVRISKRDR